MALNMVMVEAPFSTEHKFFSSLVVKEVVVAVHSSVIVVDCGDGENAILILVLVVVVIVVR